MKKIFALVLALMLVLGMTSAFAASITVNNTGAHKPETGATDNTEYQLYKIFDASFANGTDASEGVSYYTTSATVKAALEGWNINNHKFTLTAVPGSNPTKYNITSDFVDADAVALSEKLESLKSNWTAVGNAFKAGETQNNLDPGYYLVTSTLGTKIIMYTLDDENINEKNEYVTDNKTVAKTHWNVGDMVEYTITVNIPATVDYTLPVTVHDTMQDVLKLNKSTVAAKIGTADFEDFTVSDPVQCTETGKTNFNTFDIVIDISDLEEDPAVAKTIVFTYTAELLSTAAADTEYVNEEFVEYSDYTTKPKDVKVKTYDFNVAKVFSGKTTDNTLYAKFVVKQNGTAINLIQGTDATHLVRPDADDTATPFTEFNVYQNAPVNIRGLDAGTYVLHETWTAPGFNPLTEDITVTIADDGTVSINDNHGSDIALGDRHQ